MTANICLFYPLQNARHLGRFVAAECSDRAGSVGFRDHPFVYLIRDVKTGAILFLGRMVDPTQR